MTDPTFAAFAGNSRHPQHAEYLLELGRATYASIRVAGICFDILRVLGDHAESSLYRDDLGRLESKLAPLRDRWPEVDMLPEFMTSLPPARALRNDLMHALPVRDGLLRRTSGPDGRSVTFYSVSDLAEATATFQRTHRLGSRVLYHDDGALVRAWYARG
jgi:hypothetical protein